MNHDSRRLGIPSRFRLFGTRSKAMTSERAVLMASAPPRSPDAPTLDRNAGSSSRTSAVIPCVSATSWRDKPGPPFIVFFAAASSRSQARGARDASRRIATSVVRFFDIIAVLYGLCVCYFNLLGDLFPLRLQAQFRQGKQLVRRRAATCRPYEKRRQFINVHRLARHNIALGNRGQDCRAHRGHVRPLLEFGQDESSGTPDRRYSIENDFRRRHVALGGGFYNGPDDVFDVVLHKLFGEQRRLVSRALWYPGGIAGLAFLKSVSKILDCIFSHASLERILIRSTHIRHCENS